MTTSRRDDTPSFSWTRLTCVLSVLLETQSSAAISLYVSRDARYRTTVSSRLLSGPEVPPFDVRDGWVAFEAIEHGLLVLLDAS